MDSQTRLGLELLAAALALGVLGDVLLRATPWGLNAFVWIGCLTATSYGLAYRWQADLEHPERWLILPVCALALLYLGRDASMLKLTNSVALTAVLGFGIQRAQIARLRPHERLLDQPPGLLRLGVRSMLRLPAFLVHGMDWRSLRAAGRGQHVAAVVRGLFLAAPVLLVFGILLIAADALFEQFIWSLLDVDLTQLPGHVLLTLLFGWMVGGFLYGLLLNLNTRLQDEDEAATARYAPGIVEVSVVLGLLNLLLAAFVAVQASYFFGGHNTVLATEGLTLAHYARRGFFELVTVATLALPLLLGLRRWLTVETPRALRFFNGLASIQVALLVLILASAAQRMWLYQQVYGLTVLRLYVSAAIIWLAFVLIWFTMSILRDRAERFVPGAVAAGFVLVLSLHVLNPDALIARTNITRALEGKPFDVSYTAQLSADAVPALLQALPDLPPAYQADVAVLLLAHWHESPPDDWRTWNRARAAARHAVAQQAPSLQTIMQNAAPPAPDFSWHADEVDVPLASTGGPN